MLISETSAAAGSVYEVDATYQHDSFLARDQPSKQCEACNTKVQMNFEAVLNVLVKFELSPPTPRQFAVAREWN